MGIRCPDHVTPLYPQKLALTSPTGGGRSVGIVHSRTKATEFLYHFLLSNYRCGQPYINYFAQLIFRKWRKMALTFDTVAGTHLRVCIWNRFHLARCTPKVVCRSLENLKLISTFILFTFGCVIGTFDTLQLRLSQWLIFLQLRITSSNLMTVPSDSLVIDHYPLIQKNYEW